MLLRDLGYIRHAPPEANVFPVRYPPLTRQLGPDAPVAKLRVLCDRLDALQARPFPVAMMPVTSADASSQRLLHLAHFSDDDFANFQTTAVGLGAELARTQGARWSRIKITLSFTATNHPTEASRIEVLAPDGKLRPALPSELAAHRWRRRRARQHHP
jgi:hypothetical protein